MLSFASCTSAGMVSHSYTHTSGKRNTSDKLIDAEKPLSSNNEHSIFVLSNWAAAHCTLLAHNPQHCILDACEWVSITLPVPSFIGSSANFTTRKDYFDA